MDWVKQQDWRSIAAIGIVQGLLSLVLAWLVGVAVKDQTIHDVGVIVVLSLVVVVAALLLRSVLQHSQPQPLPSKEPAPEAQDAAKAESNPSPGGGAKKTELDITGDWDFRNRKALVRVRNLGPTGRFRAQVQSFAGGLFRENVETPYFLVWNEDGVLKRLQKGEAGILTVAFVPPAENARPQGGLRIPTGDPSDPFHFLHPAPDRTITLYGARGEQQLTESTLKAEYSIRIAFLPEDDFLGDFVRETFVLSLDEHLDGFRLEGNRRLLASGLTAPEGRST